MASKKVQVYKKFVWRLDDMTPGKIGTYEVGEGLDSQSARIVVAGNITEWFLRLRLYPDGVGLRLMLKDAASRNFKTKYILGIIGKNGNEERRFFNSGRSFKNGLGVVNLWLTRADFLNPDLGYLVGGNMTLYCKLTITAKEVPASNRAATLSQYQSNKFKRMLDEEIFADFDLQTSDGKVLKAHKNVLAVGSPFFYGMLTTAMKETEENVAKVTEDSVIMREVLRFIYTGNKVENLGAIACVLVFAAEKYQLDPLKKMCFANITESLNTENVLQALLDTDSLTDSETLKGKCIKMIARNFNSLCITEEWKKLSPGLLTDIMHQVSVDNDTFYV